MEGRGKEDVLKKTVTDLPVNLGGYKIKLALSIILKKLFLSICDISYLSFWKKIHTHSLPLTTLFQAGLLISVLMKKPQSLSELPLNASSVMTA